MTRNEGSIWGLTNARQKCRVATVGDERSPFGVDLAPNREGEIESPIPSSVIVYLDCLPAYLTHFDTPEFALDELGLLLPKPAVQPSHASGG